MMAVAKITRSHETLNTELRIIKDGYYVYKIEMEKYEPGKIIPACINDDQLVTEFVQAIMDAGYETGMRPSLMAKNDSTAIEAHLEDMREITKQLLEKL